MPPPARWRNLYPGMAGAAIFDSVNIAGFEPEQRQTGWDMIGLA